MCWFTPGGEQLVVLHCYKGDLDVDLAWMSTKVLSGGIGYSGAWRFDAYARLLPPATCRGGWSEKPWGVCFDFSLLIL